MDNALRDDDTDEDDHDTTNIFMNWRRETKDSGFILLYFILFY